LKLNKTYDVFGTLEAPIVCSVVCENKTEALSEAAEFLNPHTCNKIYLVAELSNGKTLKIALSEHFLKWESVEECDT
jgi:hypothetical protein